MVVLDAMFANYDSDKLYTYHSVVPTDDDYELELYRMKNLVGTSDKLDVSTQYPAINMLICWLNEKSSFDDIKWIVEQVYKHISIFKWGNNVDPKVEHRNPSDMSSKGYYSSGFCPFELKQMLFTETVRSAAFNGHVNLLKWLINTGNMRKSDYSEIIGGACANKQALVIRQCCYDKFKSDAKLYLDIIFRHQDRSKSETTDNVNNNNKVEDMVELLLEVLSSYTVVNYSILYGDMDSFQAIEKFMSWYKIMLILTPSRLGFNVYTSQQIGMFAQIPLSFENSTRFTSFQDHIKYRYSTTIPLYHDLMYKS